MKIADVARICYETNKVFCDMIGDFSQKPWDQAKQWQRDSVIEGVKYFLTHTDASDGAQHNAWVEYKIAEGWKYGLKKDANKKEHPCLVPFKDLPVEQQTKDALFTSICRACLPLIFTRR